MLNCETSQMDEEFGIRFRGYTIDDCQKLLPKATGGEQPLPEGIFWLLLTGEIPTDEQVRLLSHEWAERAALPCHGVTMLNNFPKTLHPMAQLNCAVASLNHDSKFLRAYNEGSSAYSYWEYVYEDGMDLIAKLPVIAATIYCNTYREGKGNFAVDCDADWSSNFVRMLGFKDADFTELMRLYLSIHSDHDGSNVSTHAARLVGSVLSDPFLCFSAGMSGLAGPLHGLQSHKVLMWLEKLKNDIGVNPNDEELVNYVGSTIRKVGGVPGYGHAAFETIDPRFLVLSEFGHKYLPDDEMFKLVTQLFTLVPKILTENGIIKNPTPNVNAHSGVLLHHYGMKEMNFYTVLYGVSRALGVIAQLIWDRALRLPFERPKSISTDNLYVLIERETSKKLDTPKLQAQIKAVNLDKQDNADTADARLSTEKI